MPCRIRRKYYVAGADRATGRVSRPEAEGSGGRHQPLSGLIQVPPGQGIKLCDGSGTFASVQARLRPPRNQLGLSPDALELTFLLRVFHPLKALLQLLRTEERLPFPRLGLAFDAFLGALFLKAFIYQRAEKLTGSPMVKLEGIYSALEA